MLAMETRRSAATHFFTVACFTTQREPTAPNRATPASTAEIFVTIVHHDDDDDDDDDDDNRITTRNTKIEEN
ncbi:hypothetical protein M0804_011644 [Polistes exclamans]|nr:hypothetical protein M0804_011644 [Polistes exclamans]